MSETMQRKSAGVKTRGRRKGKSSGGDGSTRVLIFGILSLIIPIFGVFLGMVALFLGVKYKLKGKGNGRIKVNIGMWMGVFSFVITLLGLIFFVPILLLM